MIYAEVRRFIREMIDSSIAFIDSGIGGLPYLRWVRLQRPNLPLSYVADTAAFPYGELNQKKLCRSVLNMVSRILSAGTPRLIAVVCNTASVEALDEIRRASPCPVVGTVPAVKPAGALPGEAPIGVLATEGTVNSAYLRKLIESFAEKKKVVKVAAGDIVRFVEERWLDEGEAGALSVMEPALNELKSQKVGSIVIGCTHFLHVLDLIRERVGDSVSIVDSRNGVGRRILSLIDGIDGAEDSNSDSKKSEPGKGGLYVTKGNIRDAQYQRFAELEGLQWGGELP